MVAGRLEANRGCLRDPVGAVLPSPSVHARRGSVGCQVHQERAGRADRVDRGAARIYAIGELEVDRVVVFRIRGRARARPHVVRRVRGSRETELEIVCGRRKRRRGRRPPFIRAGQELPTGGGAVRDAGPVPVKIRGIRGVQHDVWSRRARSDCVEGQQGTRRPQPHKGFLSHHDQLAFFGEPERSRVANVAGRAWGNGGTTVVFCDEARRFSRFSGGNFVGNARTSSYASRDDSAVSVTKRERR